MTAFRVGLAALDPPFYESFCSVKCGGAGIPIFYPSVGRGLAHLVRIRAERLPFLRSSVSAQGWVELVVPRRVVRVRH